jgi:hypothetical protein
VICSEIQSQGKGAIFSDHFISIAIEIQHDVLVVVVTFGGREQRQMIPTSIRISFSISLLQVIP